MGGASQLTAQGTMLVSAEPSFISRQDQFAEVLCYCQKEVGFEVSQQMAQQSKLSQAVILAAEDLLVTLIGTGFLPWTWGIFCSWGSKTVSSVVVCFYHRKSSMSCKPQQERRSADICISTCLSSYHIHKHLKYRLVLIVLRNKESDFSARDSCISFTFSALRSCSSTVLSAYLHYQRSAQSKSQQVPTAHKAFHRKKPFHHSACYSQYNQPAISPTARRRGFCFWQPGRWNGGQVLSRHSSSLREYPKAKVLSLCPSPPQASLIALSPAEAGQVKVQQSLDHNLQQIQYDIQTFSFMIYWLSTRLLCTVVQSSTGRLFTYSCGVCRIPQDTQIYEYMRPDDSSSTCFVSYSAGQVGTNCLCWKCMSPANYAGCYLVRKQFHILLLYYAVQAP